jgi:hypothetical protein
MSAVVDTPAQPALPGVRPQASATPAHTRRATLHRQLAEGEPIACAFVGRLLERPRLVDDPDGEGHALLRLVLRQHVMRHPQAWPVMATWDVAPHAGTAVAHETALRLAAQWEPGTELLLRGRGLEAAHLDGEPVLRVLDVMAVRALERTRTPADTAEEGATLC